jgi:5'-nucleotidase
MNERFRSWQSRAAVVLALAISGGWLLREASTCKSDPPAEFTVTIVHLNDTYEITSLDNGHSGGLARVATLLKQLRHDSPPAYALHAGDFLSPSALGTAVVEGKRLSGKQMVAVLKAAGIDYITFGNHEFDLPKDEFDDRIKEMWSASTNHCNLALLSDNVRDASHNPFPGVHSGEILKVEKTDSHPELHIGLLALTLDCSKACDSYATFDKPIDAAKARLLTWQRSEDKPDSVIALTHESLADDEKLAREVPGIDLIVGGHEHENTYRVPSHGLGETTFRIPPISRADANARTVYIHEMVFDNKTKHLKRVNSRLKAITEALEEDPDTSNVVNKYREQAYAAFRAIGLDPAEKIATAHAVLDGHESIIRRTNTLLTDMIGEAMMHVPGDAKLPRVAVYAAGEVRIDDRILPGPITMYDILRVLPFEGKLWSVPVKGEWIVRILQNKNKGIGTGAFLQTRNVSLAGDANGAGWRVGNDPLSPDKTYELIVNDYLLAGHERGLDFFARLPQDGRRDLGDWRKVVRSYLLSVKGWPVPPVKQ